MTNPGEVASAGTGDRQNRGRLDLWINWAGRCREHRGGLKGRDPEFIRRMLPRFWLLAQLYFRAEVNGFENVPDEPVLFVGNHSGGSNTPDTFVFTLAYHNLFHRRGPAIGGACPRDRGEHAHRRDFARKFGMVRAVKQWPPTC